MGTLRERIEQLEAEKARLIEVMKRQVKAALADYHAETGEPLTAEVHIHGHPDVYVIYHA